MGYCEMEQILVFVIECVVLGVGIGLLLKNIAANEKFGKILNCVNGKEKLISIAIPVLAIIMAMGYLYYGHDWGGDFSEYIAQAMALVDGTVDVEVAHMQFVLENSIPGMCPAVYPWGLPLILAVLYKIFGFNLIVFRMVGVVALAVFLCVVFRFLKKRFETRDVVIMLLLFINCKHYMEASTSILTDIPCAMLSMVAIYALYELIACEDKKQYLWSLLFGICSVAAYILRSSGVVLILTLMCVHVAVLLSKFWPFVKRQVEKTPYKKIILPAHVIPYVLFIVGKFVIEAVLPSAGNDYLAFIEGMPVTYPLSNMLFYLQVLRDFFDVGNYLAIICGVLLLILIIIGMIVKFHEEIISVIFVLGTMVMLYIFPYVSGIRYIFGLYPFFLMFAYYGAKWIFGKIQERWQKVSAEVLMNVLRYGVLCVCGFMLVFSLRMIYKIHTQPHIDSAYTEEAMEAYDFIKENTEEDAVVMFFKPRVLWLNAQRYSYNTYDDVNDLEKSDYVFFFIKDNFTQLRTYVNEHPKEYELLFDNVNFQIYKHNK